MARRSIRQKKDPRCDTRPIDRPLSIIAAVRYRGSPPLFISSPLLSRPCSTLYFVLSRVPLYVSSDTLVFLELRPALTATKLRGIDQNRERISNTESADARSSPPFLALVFTSVHPRWKHGSMVGGAHAEREKSSKS